ncbi:MAG: endolytic transglycosylase MltG [Gordonia sp. (in: high G+C Gram-positive bacteria)]|uniref:endolytic transglycosylase MltG n=1 Tax=Gordonia sp. (in: high G+C Gram-positive bacteria) TaxID=84139 RepID=UPI0039E42659
MSDDMGATGSDDKNDQPAPSTRHRTRRGQSTGQSGAPAWMTGEIPAVGDDDASAEAEKPNVTPNVVKRVERPAAKAAEPVEAPEPVVDETPDPEPEPAPAAPVVSDEAAKQAEADAAAAVAALASDEPVDEPAAPATPAWHADHDDAEEAEKQAKKDDADAKKADKEDKKAAKKAAKAEKKAAAADADEMPGRGRGKKLVLVAAALVAVLVVGYGGLKVANRQGWLPASVSNLMKNKKDYSDTTGSEDVLVTIPANSSLTNMGAILEEAGVVGSTHAFILASDGTALSAGVYKLRKGISAKTAVKMMSGTEHRVGRLVVPEGVQLENKKGVDRKTTPGVFDLIADATSVELNGKKVGVTTEQLEQAAKTASADELGIPSWARDAVAKLPGDYRRIEGLIAPGTWEAVNPEASAQEILNQLISDSARRYESWGLTKAGNKTKLSLYEVLIAASINEREVRHPEDLPKVARVILNRLAKDQRLEMDSTTNYTAAETNIDVHGENYKADTKWNTYKIFGLPPTPIATVGEGALKAMLDPPPGNWLYFLTVDKDGKTLFSENFDEHVRKRQIACENKFLKTGC